MKRGKDVLLLRSNIAVVDLEVPKEEVTGMNIIEVNMKNTIPTIITTTTQAGIKEADIGEGYLN